MDYQTEIDDIRRRLIQAIKTSQSPRQLLRDKQLKALVSKLPNLAPEERAKFGRSINELKSELEALANEVEAASANKDLPLIDVTAPFDVNVDHQSKPSFPPALQGSIHPVNQEFERVLDIFARMGFDSIESRQLDDEFHMFTSLNFPKNHPARDDYDTFITEEGLIAPAHTSVMQNRILKARSNELESGKPIACVIPGKVFRNEDLDARHEHTFHQIEGIYVAKDVAVGDLIGTFKTFLETYYEQKLSVRVNPFYFPFTEPSFEFSLSCPFCEDGCKVCSYELWIELLGMGMIHPNVLEQGGVDPEIYTGFAWGLGFERLVMMKHNIEDVRHFHSAKLDFLRQFGVSK